MTVSFADGRPQFWFSSDSFAQRQHTCGHSSGFESGESYSVVFIDTQDAPRYGRICFAYFSAFWAHSKKGSLLRETLKKELLRVHVIRTLSFSQGKSDVFETRKNCHLLGPCQQKGPIR